MVLIRLDYNLVKLMIGMVYLWWALSKYKLRLCLYNVDVVYPNLKAVNVVTKTKNAGNHFRNPDFQMLTHYI